jgi:hypothetical protein
VSFDRLIAEHAPTEDMTGEARSYCLGVQDGLRLAASAVAEQEKSLLELTGTERDEHRSV